LCSEHCIIFLLFIIRVESNYGMISLFLP